VQTDPTAPHHRHDVTGPYPPAVLHGVVGGGYGVGYDAGLFEREVRRDRHELGGRDFDELGVGAVHVVPRHHHVLAEVLSSGATVAAPSAGQDRRDQHPISGNGRFDSLSHGVYDARILVPQDQRRWLERAHSVIQIVQIRMAHSAARYPHERLARPRPGRFDLRDLQRLPGAMKHGCFHLGFLV
jgi:hypothetical protein